MAAERPRIRLRPQRTRAADSFRAAVAIRERLVRDEPNHIDIQHNLMISDGSLGDVLGYRPGENLGDLHGAEAAYVRAIEIARAVISLFPRFFSHATLRAILEETLRFKEIALILVSRTES